MRPDRQRHARNRSRLALLVFDDSGDADYEGETVINWNNQASQHDETGRDILECPEGHQWPAEREE